MENNTEELQAATANHYSKSIDSVVDLLQSMKAISDNSTNADLLEYNLGYSLGISQAIRAIETLK